MIPGEYFLATDPVAQNAGRDRLSLRVVNGGDRPVQVGSHFHFAETNPALLFDREAARGWRLDVPAGTSVRFEPGIERDVTLVQFAGSRVAAGFRGLVAGPLDPTIPSDDGSAPGGVGDGSHPIGPSATRGNDTDE